MPANRQFHRNRRAVARQSPRENLARQRTQPHRPRHARHPSPALPRNQNGTTPPHPNRKRRRRNLTRKKPHENQKKLRKRNWRGKNRKRQNRKKRRRLALKSAGLQPKAQLHRHARLLRRRQFRRPNQKLPALFHPANERRLSSKNQASRKIRGSSLHHPRRRGDSVSGPGLADQAAIDILPGQSSKPSGAHQ